MRVPKTPPAQNVLGLVGSTATRRHRAMDCAQRPDLHHPPRQPATVPHPVHPHRTPHQGRCARRRTQQATTLLMIGPVTSHHRGGVSKSLARKANQNSAIVAVSPTRRPVISSTRWIRYTTVCRCTSSAFAVLTHDRLHDRNASSVRTISLDRALS